jgi:hypothetical protein
MPDSSLPYLGDIAITPKLPCVGDKVQVAVSWSVQSVRPNIVEIYAYFGIVESNLWDRGNIVESYQPGQTPITLTFTRVNHDPFLYIGVAPRNVENGQVTDTMPDASGEMQSWDNFASEQGMTITYTSPPIYQVPPPIVQAVSVPKTLGAGDHLDVTVIGGNSDSYNLIVNDGEDEAQRGSSDGLFPGIPSTPGTRYFLRAQQHNKGSAGGPPMWSAFSKATPIVAVARMRAVRNFLSLSGVLNPGTGVRQYASRSADSIRTMMGL